MHRAHGARALADCGCHAFHGAVSHVASCEHRRHVGFERPRGTSERWPRDAEVVGAELHVGANEPVLVDGLVSSSLVTRLVSVMRSSARPPCSRVTSVERRMSMRGSAMMRSTRYWDIPAAMSGPRIANVTELFEAASVKAAWPAEFAPPTTVTGRPMQRPTSSAVAA
jgi:hypothetical protein